ncbi:MAG: hypothetical protein M4579_002069 [Chaenotheca gracillima]|nr:MAG: hypothetical protein M4579_002069 [Chaenotheca gracillima]
MAVYTSPKRKRDAPESMAGIHSSSPEEDEGRLRRSSPLRLRVDFGAAAATSASFAPAPAQAGFRTEHGQLCGQPLSGNGSPGGKVTTQFEGLKLMGGEGMPKLDWTGGQGGDGLSSPTGRKRMKQMNGSDIEYSQIKGSASPTPPLPTEALKASNSPPAQADTKGRKSPPLHSSTITGDDPGAALTWQEHEITGHIADDPDDDGEGVNGIGFKPTTAMVQARTERRKQQVQEYKSREAREARRARSERRTREKGVERVLERGVEKRKVRFWGEEVE